MASLGRPLSVCVVLALVASCKSGQPPTVASSSGEARAVSKGLLPPGSMASSGDCRRTRPGVGPARASADQPGGAVVLGVLGGKTVAYVADEDSRALHLASLDDGVQLSKTPLAGTPGQALVLADGRVAVALRDRSSVQVFEPAPDPRVPLTPLCEVVVPAEAFGLATTADGARLLVTSAWGARLTVLDGQSLARVREVALPREPRSVVVDGPSRRAFVSHAIGAHVSVVDLDEAGPPRLVALRVHAGARPEGADQAAGRAASQGFALAKAVAVEKAPPIGEQPPVAGRKPPAARPGAGAPKTELPKSAPPGTAPAAPAPATQDRIFVPMATVEPGNPFERSSDYYGFVKSREFPAIAEPVVGVVDALREQSLTRDLLNPRADSDYPCLLPRAAAVDARSATVLVACLGTDLVVELDARAADPMRLALRRFRVAAGPTGIAVDPRRLRAAVWSQHAGKLTVLSLGKPSARRTIDVAYAPRADAELLRSGRDLFHRTEDSTLSSNGLACASCHPDGRDDGLTWATSSGPRQTLMLAGRVHGSGPYGWQGQHGDLEGYVSNTITRLGGRGLEGARLHALVEYLERMPAPPVLPEALPVDRARALARGRELFFGASGCSGCHLDARGTDRRVHDIGTKVTADEKPEFDTPTLRFVKGTAPYFHDGRYKTLAELLADEGSRMGGSARLDPRDRDALAAFLETL